jgi:hypothetical protein
MPRGKCDVVCRIEYELSQKEEVWLQNVACLRESTEIDIDDAAGKGNGTELVRAARKHDKV